MKINQAGLALLKEFEGLRLEAYKCPAGVLTIGYGHTGADVHESMHINHSMAQKLLEQDLEKFETGVSKLLKVKVNDNQFSAMVCFAYNVGLGNLKQSTLLNCVNKIQFQSAAKEFLRWNKAGGKVLAGLTRRREAESALFSQA